MAPPAVSSEGAGGRLEEQRPGTAATATGAENFDCDDAREHHAHSPGQTLAYADGSSRPRGRARSLHESVNQDAEGVVVSDDWGFTPLPPEFMEGLVAPTNRDRPRPQRAVAPNVRAFSESRKDAEQNAAVLFPPHVVPAATELLLLQGDRGADKDSRVRASTALESLEAPRRELPNPDALRLDSAGLTDATIVAAEGREIAASGIPWVVDGLIPGYGMLGFLVGYAKVGKTTLAQALGAAVARGEPFLGRHTAKARVLVIAAEDPSEYVAYIARHLVVEPDAMTFCRSPLVLDAEGRARVIGTAQEGGYGLVLISSWQAVVRSMVRDENDNAGAAMVVESVKASTRETGIPWVIDAHSGKGEDQTDDADPSKAQRGASAIAAAADFTISLRFGPDGTFGTQRRLSARGRFVSLAAQTLAFDEQTGTYECLGSTKEAAVGTDWRLLSELGAISDEWRAAGQIAVAAGIISANGSANFRCRRRVCAALRGRPGVQSQDNGKSGSARRVHYRLVPQ